ncbi:uncharacterized protein LOC119680915 isoform X2 [Teleopsis dalmanni]|uniref:uncharacterized protein LOC119680915 isoform X2 n=1 Tax=Teleopsis dalmanni TaxID=139649 RepID=UPI0018CD98CC|nr:uncharacterized protein LOC119680915 isoform X2 [Teleopsis dalmanni]
MDNIKTKDTSVEVSKKNMYSEGDIVLACFEDGVYYKAKIVELSGDGTNCIINYINYDELYSVGFDKIKPLNIDTSLTNRKGLIQNDVPHHNKDYTEKKMKEDIKMFEVSKEKFHESDMVLADNHITQNLQYLVGDKVLATYDDGVEYIAEITKIGENGKCIVKFIEYNDLYETSVNKIKHTLYKSLNKPEDHLEVVSALNDSHQGTIKQEFTENKLKVSSEDERFKEIIDNVTYIKTVGRNESPKNLLDIGNLKEGSIVRISHENGELRDAQIVKLSNKGTFIVKYKDFNDLYEVYSEDIHTICDSNIQNNKSHLTTKSLNKLSEFVDVMNDKNGVLIRDIQSDGVMHQTSGDDRKTVLKFDKTELFNFREGDHVLAAYTDGEYYPAKIVKISRKKNSCKVVYTEYDDTLYKIGFNKIKSIDVENKSITKDRKPLSSFESTAAFLKHSAETLQVKDLSKTPSDAKDIIFSVGDNVLAVYNGEKYRAVVISVLEKENICCIKYDDYDEIYEVSLNDIEPNEEKKLKNWDNKNEKILVQKSLNKVNKSTNVDRNEISIISEPSEGEEVFVKYEDDKYYKAIIVNISSNTSSCVVKYIDYDECCEVSMNNIKRVDEISDNDTGTPITRNKIEVQDLLTNDSTKLREENYIPDFKIGQKVLTLYEDGEFYLAEIVSICSNSNSCVVKFIDYDECYEVSMNNIKEVDEISDNDTGTPITTNIIEVQRLLINDSAKLTEENCIPDFKIGQKVLALYEDGEFYLAEIVTISSKSDSCVVKYIDYDECCEVSMSNIKEVDKISDKETGTPTTTNIIEVQDLLTNDSSKIDEKNCIPNFKIGQKVLALHEDGEFCLAKIVIVFSNSNACVVKYIDYDDCCEVSMNNIKEVDEVSDNVTGTPITINKSEVEELLTSDSRKMDEEICIPEFKIGQKVLALHEDGEFYLAKIVTIFSNSNSCVVKYIDYDECCEVSMSNIKEFDEIADKETGTPTTTNIIELQDLLTNDSTELGEGNCIPEFKIGQKVLALHEDGEFYLAKIVTIFSNSNSCVVKYIDYDDCCEVSMSNIKELDEISDNDTETSITTNKIDVQELLTNDSTKMDEENCIPEFKIGQKVLALYEDGEFYPAEIVNFSSKTDSCVVKYIDYDECCEVSMNNIKEVDEVSDDTGTPIITNIIELQDLLTNDSKELGEGNCIPEFKIGQKVLVLYEDGEFYPAEIVNFSSKTDSCVVKYIDYDECCEVSMNNIKEVDEVSDDTGTPIITNIIELQDLLTNDSTELGEGNCIPEFKIGQKVLALHEDGEFYLAKIVTILSNSNSCVVKYIEYDECCEVSMSNIKEVDEISNNDTGTSNTTNKIEVQELLTNDSTKLGEENYIPEFKIGQKVLALYEDGEFYPAEIVNFSSKTDSCVVKYIDYDECCEVSMNNIKEVDEVSDDTGTPIITNIIELQDLLTNDSKELGEGNCVPEFEIGQKVLALYEDGVFYPAEIVTISSKTDSCVVKYIDYDECCEVSMSNIKEVDEIADKETGTPTTTNIIDVQDLLTNDYTELGEENYIPNFKIGQKVLALHEDGEFYLVEIVTICSNSNFCVVKFIDYDEYCEVSMNNIKELDEISDNDAGTLISTNIIEVQELLTKVDRDVCSVKYDDSHDHVEINITNIKPIMNKICNNSLNLKKECTVNYSVGDEVIIKNIDGTDNVAIIYEFLDDDFCILQFNDNKFEQAFVGDIKPRESCEIKNYEEIIHETEINNILTGNSFNFNRDEEKSNLRNTAYKDNWDKFKDVSTSFLKKSSTYNNDHKSLYVKNDIIKAIHIDGNHCMDSILKLLNTDLGLIKFNDLNLICDVELNKITKGFSENFSVHNKSLITTKVPAFSASERIICIYEDSKENVVEIRTIRSIMGTYIVKLIKNKNFIEFNDFPKKPKNNIKCSESEIIPQSSTEAYCGSVNDLSIIDIIAERKNLLCAEPEIIIILSDGRSCPAKVIRFNSDVNTWVIKVLGFDILQEINIENLKPNIFYEQHQKKQLKQTSSTQDSTENHIASLHKSKEDYSNVDKDESITIQVVQYSDENLQDNDSMAVFNNSVDGFQNKGRHANALVKCEEEKCSVTKLKVGDFVRAFYLDGQVYDAKVMKIFESNQTYQIKYLALDVELNIPWRLVSPIKSSNLDLIHSFPIMTNEDFYCCYYHYFSKLVRNQ